MPKRILVRVPIIKATAKAAATAANTIRYQADHVVKGGKCEAEAKLDEFGLLTYNYSTIKTTTAEKKRMLQPASTSTLETPNANNHNAEDEIISSISPPPPPKKKAKSYKKRCSVEGCTRQAQKKGVCCSHGAKCIWYKKECKVENCTKGAKKGGLCIAHGSPKPKKKPRKQCSYEGCTVNPLKNNDCCWRHMPKKTIICSVEGCSYKAYTAQRLGECWRHAQESVLRKILREEEEEQARCTTNDQNNNRKEEEERARDDMGDGGGGRIDVERKSTTLAVG